MSAVTQQKSASPRAGCGTPAQSQSCIRVDLSNGFGGDLPGDRRTRTAYLRPWQGFPDPLGAHDKGPGALKRLAGARRETQALESGATASRPGRLTVPRTTIRIPQALATHDAGLVTNYVRNIVDSVAECRSAWAVSEARDLQTNTYHEPN
jgi:hypothetical protein